MKKLFYTCLLPALFVSCHNSQQSSDKPTMPMDSAAGVQPPKNFFPVLDYLRGEIRNVDSTPVAIRKYEIHSSGTDSGFIRPVEFDRLAGRFLLSDLEPASLEKDYTETAFQDETTGYLTFTYTAKNTDRPLHRVDVLTSPGRAANQVKSIYLERAGRTGDTVWNDKMYWKAGQEFLIVTSRKLPGQQDLVNQLKIVWGSPPAQD